MTNHTNEDRACVGCGTPLNEGEAKTFTVCDACWDKTYPKPQVDIHGRILAAEGYVQVPREMAEAYRRIWFEPDQRKVRVEREAAERALAIFFADALGGEKEGDTR